MAMAINMMLYLGNEKVTLIEKERQGMVEDFHVALGCGYKMGLRYISTLQRRQRRSIACSYAVMTILIVSVLRSVLPRSGFIKIIQERSKRQLIETNKAKVSSKNEYSGN